MSSKSKVRKPTSASTVKAATSSERSLPTKKIRSFEVKLTAEEVTHLRDLMSIMLPPDGSTTLSQSLANAEGRPMQESKLWSKIVAVCKLADIPTDNEAPDYAVGIVGAPTLAVYPLQLKSDESDIEE